MTTQPRKTKHDSHFLLVPKPLLERDDHSTSLDRLKLNSDVVKKDSFPRRKLCRVETSQHPAGKVSQQYQSCDGEHHNGNREACERHTFFQSSVLLRKKGVRTCRQYQRRFRLQEPKFDERLFDTTNNSVLSFQTSQGCFGRSKQRRTSLRRQAVPSARPFSISPASANGPATRLQQSSLKFLGVTRRAT